MRVEFRHSGGPVCDECGSRQVAVVPDGDIVTELWPLVEREMASLEAQWVQRSELELHERTERLIAERDYQEQLRVREVADLAATHAETLERVRGEHARVLGEAQASAREQREALAVEIVELNGRMEALLGSQMRWYLPHRRAVCARLLNEIRRELNRLRDMTYAM